MGLDIQIKETETSTTMMVGLYELKARIQRGEARPDVLVCDRVLTNNEWWTLDNLNIFHNNSPIKYPPGRHLREKQDIQQQRNDAQARWWQLIEEYRSGNLLEQRFNLASLADLHAQHGVVGITRLWILPSFEPERVFTFIYEEDSILIHAAQGQTSLWQSLPQVDSVNGVWQEIAREPFDPSQIVSRHAKIPLNELPEILNQWNNLVTATRLATSCNSLCIDGISFRHSLFGAAEFNAYWCNPAEDIHPLQCTLLKAYRRCAAIAQLEQFWKGPTPNSSSLPNFK